MDKEPWYITKSKKRCYQLGLNPRIIPAFTYTLTNDQLERKRKEFEEVLGVVRFFIQKMLNLLEGIPLQIGISDENGYILEINGNETIQKTNNDLGIHLGMRFIEEEMGVNSISLALMHRQPIQVIGTNHFFEPLFTSACYTVPFQYSDENNLLGTITIMTSILNQSPVLLAMLSTMGDSIERELLLRKQNQRLFVLNQIMMKVSNNGIIITDKDGLITEYNEFVANQTECPKRNLIGKNISELAPYGTYISTTLSTNEKFENIEIRLQQKSLMENFNNKMTTLLIC